MNDRVKEMYEKIVMSEDCAQRIQYAMAGKGEPLKKSSVQRYLRTAAAALAAVVLILSLSPTVRAAIESMVVKYFFPDSGITIYEEEDAEGNVSRIVALDTESESFAKVREGRLYFTGNGENIDITEQITEKEPFYYSYTDDYGLTHFMAVGYSGSIENFGVYEFMREEKKGQQAWEGWVNGYGRNFLDPETEMCYPWVESVWEELDVPWPMPGT